MKAGRASAPKAQEGWAPLPRGRAMGAWRCMSTLLMVFATRLLT